MNDDFADLDFEGGIAAFSFIDRKVETRLNLGLVSRPPKDIAEIAGQFDNIMLGIESAGIEQDRLDQICNSMKIHCRSHDVKILIAKGNRPFASRWYVLGDLERLFYLAESGIVTVPFSHSIHDQIWTAHHLLSETNQKRR